MRSVDKEIKKTLQSIDDTLKRIETALSSLKCADRQDLLDELAEAVKEVTESL